MRVRNGQKFIGNFFVTKTSPKIVERTVFSYEGQAVTIDHFVGSHLRAIRVSSEMKWIVFELSVFTMI